MKRFVRFLAAVTALGLAFAVHAQQYAKGRDYFKLSIPVETRDPEKIEVVEVFSYGCIHCYELEPDLNAWLLQQGDDVDFHRVPLAPTRNHRVLAQIFYTAQAMDVLPEVHIPVFEAIHAYGIDMSRPRMVLRIFAHEAKVEEEEFMRTFDSFAINTRVGQADAQTRLYRVQGTPSMIVDGRYLVDTVSAGSGRRMLAVVDYLIDLERAARESKASEAGGAGEKDTREDPVSPPSS